MRKIYLFITLLLALTSCNNWLDVELDNKVDDDKLFSSVQGFKEALAGVYSQMAASNMYGQALTMEYTDLLASYYSYSSVSNTYQYWKDYDYSNSGVKGNISSMWTRLYHCISQVNCILMWADRNSSVLTPEEYNQICGEAIGLRAYLHFDLYRLFSPDVKERPQADGIPYNKEFGVSLPPMYSAAEAIQLIINDLKEAERLLANDPIVNVVPYTFVTEKEGEGAVIDADAKDRADQYVARMNLYGVKAMLARAYQARGEYTKAIDTAQEVIDSGKFRLLEFSSIDQSEANTDLLFSDEHIFSLRNRQLGNYSTSLHYNKVSGGTTTFAPLPYANVSSMYDSNNDDVRYSKWFDMGSITKFLADSASVYTNKMPMIKLSEMYLLIAECSYHAEPEKALKYVNTLRTHRIRNNRDWSSITQTYIIEEMRREYVGEGQMWYVYKRNGLPVPTGSGEAIDKDKAYIFPLPDSEIEDGHR